VAGRYILTPGIFDEIANQPRGVGGEIQLTDGIANLMRREKVCLPYEGKRYDCGSKEGFLEANVELALAHPQLGAGFREYLKTLPLSADGLVAEPGGSSAPQPVDQLSPSDSWPPARGRSAWQRPGSPRDELGSVATTLSSWPLCIRPAPSWPSEWAAGS
jgi:hypothetical protein